MGGGKFSRGKGRRNLGLKSPSGGCLPVSSRRQSPFCTVQEQSVHMSASREVFDDHRLISTLRGESEVEELALRISDRMHARITITGDVRDRFMRSCRKIARDKGYPGLTKIRLADLISFRDEVHHEVEKSQLQNIWDNIIKLLGFRSQSEQLLTCLDKAIDIVRKQEEGDAGWFYYMDFHIYYTKIESRWPWMRSPAAISIASIIVFYLFSPIFFCYIVRDKGVCPADPSGSRSYHGWMSTLYFASTTLSTVGYGDLSVDKESDWSIFAGIIYMILCNVMLIVAFSAAADSSTTIFTRLNDWILKWVWGSNDSELITKKVRRITFLRIGQIVCTFVFLNLIGVFASRIFILYTDVEAEKWNWMTSFYWAVQTTTTIGYGDLTMAFNLRWFQIFYLILSTYFVGNTLGGLANLKDEIHEIQQHSAWNRRELSKGLIDELQPYDHDDKIDQYEFVMASLVILGKVSYGDVVPIMDKFRSLAGNDGFIAIDETPKPISEDPELGGQPEDSVT